MAEQSPLTPSAHDSVQPILLRLPDVQRALGIGRSAVYDFRANDPTFPKPVQLTPYSVAWHRDEIEAWARARPRVDRAPLRGR